MATTITTHSEPVSARSDVAALDFENGEVLLVDKPLDWTSFDVVHRVRDLFHVQKVGHAGTLDPKATGLLILCTGKKTKSIEEYTGQEKEYEGTMQLGTTTASFDSETPTTEAKGYLHITEDRVQEVFRSFMGKQLQVPPMFSAVKYGGKPLYKYARKGRTLERQSREIDISRFELLSMALPHLRFRIVCSKGTYIRTIVDDCGKVLGCGAYLTQLRRTRIGNMSVDDALQLEDLHSLGQRFTSRIGV